MINYIIETTCKKNNKVELMDSSVHQLKGELRSLRQLGREVISLIVQVKPKGKQV